VDGPGEIIRAVPNVRLLAAMSFFESDTFKGLSGAYWLMAKVMLAVPALRKMAQFHRYAF
jgi:hypothetical protein